MLLVVFGAGVFLAGLELMITAVALPSILADLVDAAGTSAWMELRKASWIINGYLLVYILTMPLAGRLADLWGARRLFLGALGGVRRRVACWPGAAQDLDQLIAARLVQAVGGGVLVPVGTAAAAHLYDGHGPGPGARGHRRADVPGHGRRAVPRRRDPGRRPSGATRWRARAWRRDRGRASWRRPGAGSSTSTSRSAIVALALAWAASAGWETPRRAGRIDLAGRRSCSASRWRPGCSR